MNQDIDRFDRRRPQPVIPAQPGRWEERDPSRRMRSAQERQVVQGASAPIDNRCSPQSLLAISLAPLIEIAWAGGGVVEHQQVAILEWARDQGLEPAHPAWRSLMQWMNVDPRPHLFASWREHYVNRLSRILAWQARQAWMRNVLDRVEAIARMRAPGSEPRYPLSSDQRRVLEQVRRSLG
jgi:hypothetical protein